MTPEQRQWLIKKCVDIMHELTSTVIKSTSLAPQTFVNCRQVFS